MKLNEALKAAAAARGLPVVHEAFLACGFEPLHLPVFLQAHHLARHGDGGLSVSVGVYGDLLGNVERARAAGCRVVWVVLEWSDLDPRIGWRSSGPWGAERQVDVLASVRARLGALKAAVERLAQGALVVVALPALTFPLLGHTTGWQASELELELELELASFARELARIERARVLHPGRVAALSPATARSDARAELATGFPFTIEHTSVLAEGLLELGFPRAPKKGLITDLDDTFWAGIVGEVGPTGVHWSQAERAQLHGLYQSLLRQLANAGVLLAVASKNERDVAEAALRRSDLLIDSSAFFPLAISWGPKSEAVTAILRAWNIDADAVVVVDDSRMELEEIRRQHPGITALEFAPKDPSRVVALLSELRDLFGKPALLADDKLRLASIRSAASFEQQLQSRDLAGFLASLDGAVSFDPSKRQGQARLLELLNKTNQFNLNGVRVSDGEWARWLAAPDSIVLGVSYADRYGALGTIGVIVGKRLEPDVLEVWHWVLSCRAFSRRIEEHTLRHLFNGSGCRSIVLRYRQTERNKPFQELLARLGLEAAAGREVQLDRERFESIVSDLPHRELVAEGA